VAGLSKVHFDDRSFVLTVPDSQLAVEFDVPQRGIDVPHEVIPLDPIRPAAPGWWSAIASAFARPENDLDRWLNPASKEYDVIARYDSSAENARLSITDGEHEWPVRVVAAPVLHVFWLDRSPLDSAARRALARAFDDAALYDESTRTVRLPRAAYKSVRVRFAASRPRARNSTRHRA
jgi:hypothetical protein